ncbi:hypothetical protein DFS34DRAFT_698493 [Phlyctochytrium arcticum]|nr:hypothetical protein DFS34DRAFT_698493 [Phlyctochytrium arcticum]
MDTDPLKLGCNNGYIDLTDGQLKPYTLDVLISKSVGYNYFDSDHPFSEEIYNQWLDFVEKLFPIPEEREIAQIYAGYTLRGDHPEKIFVVFKDITDGNNGKTKFAQALLAGLGTYGVSGNAEHIYQNTGFSSQSNHNAALFAYENIRLSVFEELDEKRKLDNKQAKMRHGGNARIGARRPYSKKDEMVNLYTRWILIFNDRCQPQFDTSDNALLNRMLVFLFRAKFLSAEEYKDSDLPYKQLADNNISDKFKIWQPYIMKWMLEGHQKYLEKGFTQIPAECRKWKQDVANAVENLQDWIDENIEEMSDDLESIVTLKDIKERMPQKMQTLFKDKKHFIDKLNMYLKDYVADTKKSVKFK